MSTKVDSRTYQQMNLSNIMFNEKKHFQDVKRKRKECTENYKEDDSKLV